MNQKPLKGYSYSDPIASWTVKVWFSADEFDLGVTQRTFLLATEATPPVFYMTVLPNFLSREFDDLCLINVEVTQSRHHVILAQQQ